jgi:hypothetical protein
VPQADRDALPGIIGRRESFVGTDDGPARLCRIDEKERSEGLKTPRTVDAHKADMLGIIRRAYAADEPPQRPSRLTVDDRRQHRCHEIVQGKDESDTSQGREDEYDELLHISSNISSNSRKHNPSPSLAAAGWLAPEPHLSNHQPLNALVRGPLTGERRRWMAWRECRGVASRPVHRGHIPDELALAFADV